MPTFDPSDLIGRTFLLPPEENGERHRAKVTRQVVEIVDQDNGQRIENDTIYIKTQVFRLLRYYSPAPRNIARSDWVTQNTTHNMTASIL